MDLFESPVYPNSGASEGESLRKINRIMAGASQGGYVAPPASSTNGTELAGRPEITSGVRIEVASGGSITYYIGPTGVAPTGAPSLTKTVSEAGTVDEPLSGADSIFVTASSGAVILRWVRR